MAREDPAPALGFCRRAGGLERTGDGHPLDIGQAQAATPDVAAQERLRRHFGERGGAADEGGGDGVLAGPKRQPHVHVLVGGERLAERLRRVLEVDDQRLVGVFGSHREQLDALAVDRELDSMLLADAADLSGGLAAQADADLVLAGGGQILVDADAAARAQREGRERIVLRQVLGRLVGGGDRRRAGVADREPAHLARGGHVAFEQERRDPQRVRHVVEAVRRVVGGQVAGVDLDREQIAHRVARTRRGSSDAAAAGPGSGSPPRRGRARFRARTPAIRRRRRRDDASRVAASPACAACGPPSPRSPPDRPRDRDRASRASSRRR